MKVNCFVFVLVLVLWPLAGHAQWRLGATGGYGYNDYSIDTHYMIDYRYTGVWGKTLGVMGQYDVNDWLGVRAELNMTEKNHRLRRSRDQRTMDYKVYNSYLQLPLMASLGFGGRRVRGFCNVGVYGGYWLYSRMRGFDVNVFSGRTYFFKQRIDFNDERDQRWDFGLAGGLGVEWRFARHWGAQVEGRCYYSTTSTQKDYQRINDPRYNTFIGVQAAVCYFLGKGKK